jgi:glycosyltransferase involved in cell wall biosynthesis
MSKLTPTKPTIIHVTSYYPPHLDGLGGQEKGTALRAERFVDRGYTVSVYTSDIGYSPKAASNTKVQVHYLKSIELAHTPIMFTLFFRLLALPRHSLIHLHVAQAFTPEIVYLISKLKGIPYIAHIHLDVDPSGPLGFLLETYKKLFLKRVLKSAAKILCISDANKRLIASKYALPLEPIVMIPNGVAEEYFVGKRTSQNPVPHLLFVGRLSVQKNLPLLIEAVSQMQTSVFLDIVGEGELRENLEALIQKYKLQNVKLHGQKTGSELIEFYKSADIFVLPSFKEAGLPNSVLEALAAGLPIVASDLPEIRDSLDECAVLIQDATATNYARTLDALLSNKQAIQNMSILSVQKARSRSWKNVLDATEDLYKETWIV